MAAPGTASAPQRILLTGATGYVGAATVRAFKAAGLIDKLTCVVRNADRAQEVIEEGATLVRVVPSIFDVPKIAGEYDCVLNTVGAGGEVTYAKEQQFAEEVMAALKTRPNGGAFVQLSGTGCCQDAYAADGPTAAEYTDWANFTRAMNPKRHVMEKAVVLAHDPGQHLRTALIRPTGVYGADARSDFFVRPLFRTAEENGAARVNGEGKNIMPLIHVDDVADLCLKVAMTPSARGIFHAAEEAFASKDTSPRHVDLAQQASEAAGKNGKVEHKDARGGTERTFQTIVCQNSLSLGWKPRQFDAKKEWEDYQKAKANWLKRNGKKPGEQGPADGYLAAAKKSKL